MTEILTESFCERCGTRYTFESVAPKQNRMGGIRTLGRGLRNFVLSDDSSLDEAMAEARSDVEREATAQQLDAFHRTFNFCMSCRQYTCGNCWNEIEARCLSCAPLPKAEIAAAMFAAPPTEVDLERLLRLTAPPSEVGVEAEPEAAWPSEALPEAVWPGEAQPDAAWPTEAAATEAEPASEPEVPALAAAEAEVPSAAAAEPDAAEAEVADEEVLVAEAAVADWAPVERPTGVAADGVEAGALPDWATLRPAAESPSDAETDLEAAFAAEVAEDEPLAAARDAAAPDAEVLAEEPAPAEPALQGLVPGESLDDAIAAYEAAQAGAAEVEPAAAEPAAVEPALAEAGPAEAVPAVGVAGGGPGVDVVGQPTWPSARVAPQEPAPAEAAPEAEPVAAAPEPEPEPIAAAPEPEPEPVTVAPEPEPVAEPEAQPVAVAAAPAPPEPVAPPAPPAVAPVPPVAPLPSPDGPTGAPQWPTGPRWPTGIPARPTVPQPTAPGPAGSDPLTAIMARQATEAMWAASSRDVVQPPLVAQAPTAAVQPCVSCGISLSATARFCRRCGTAQAG